ncbi:zonadhesin-like [Episyrphus balteatus]|uniref:zonadhesin-like n=1 Tax=Episyrphus balteatus TaxID=286459 RepID=UPI0024851FB0|nr:zonadhesin-like [Episyrphus balteatus]
MKSFITISLFALAVLVNQSNGLCNTCSVGTPIACVSETAYKFCVDGVFASPSINCSSGSICSSSLNNGPCALAGSVPPSCQKCNLCNDEKVFACTDYNEFALCLGTDRVQSKKFTCPAGSVCNLGSKNICVDPEITGLGGTCPWKDISASPETPIPSPPTPTPNALSEPDAFCQQKGKVGRFEISADPTCKKFISCNSSNDVLFGSLYVCPRQTFFDEAAGMCGINPPSRCAPTTSTSTSTSTPISTTTSSSTSVPTLPNPTNKYPGIMKFLIVYFFLASILCYQSNGLCNTCSSDIPIACVSKTEYKFCIDGVFVWDSYRCPSGTICSSSGTGVCVPEGSEQPPCAKCNVCNDTKLFACTNYNEFALCLGTDVPVSPSYTCREGLVCNIHSRDICVDPEITGLGGTCPWKNITSSTIPSETTISTTTSTPLDNPNLFCQQKGEVGRFEIPSDPTCKKFISCNFSNNFIFGSLYVCPRNTYFNENSKVCAVEPPARCAPLSTSTSNSTSTSASTPSTLP